MFYTRSEWVYGLTTSDIPFSSGWVVYNRGKSGILGSIRRPSFLEGGGKNRMSSTGGTAYLCSSKDMQFPGRRRSIFPPPSRKFGLLILPGRPAPVCSNRIFGIVPDSDRVRCTAGVGSRPYSVPAVHRRSDPIDPGSWSSYTSLRRRYTNIRVLSTVCVTGAAEHHPQLCWRCSDVDAV